MLYIHTQLTAGTHTHTHTHTHTERDTERERHTHTHTHTRADAIDSQRDIHRCVKRINTQLYSFD